MKNVPGMMGKKVGMTQIFDADGNSVPVTVVQLGENIVTQTRSKENNGYCAVQIGGFVVKEKRMTKPEKGSLTKHELPMLKPLKEYRVPDASKFKIGEPLNAEELFKAGMLVDVQGKSIGKGFQGTIKRYNAGRGPMSHGSKFHRSMGSIGPGTTPGRVFKGIHMPGQMGNVTATVRKLEVVRVDAEKRLILVRGAIPGSDGGTVILSPSITKWNA